MRVRFISLHLDSFGFFASFLCALHCALLPVLLVLLPFASRQLLMGHAVELLLLGLSFMMACVSLVQSYHKHRRRQVLILMFGGFVLVILGLTLMHTQAMEVVLTSTGGLIVALGHYLSWRYTHKH